MSSNTLVHHRTPAAAEPTRARLYALFWRWHFFAALIVIPFVLWQSTTGVLYLWSEWWMDHAYPTLRFVTASQRAVAPSAQIAAALSAASRLPGAAGSPSAQSDAHAGHIGPMPQHALATDHADASTRGVAGAGREPQAGAALAGVAVQNVLLSDDPRRSTTVLVQDAHGLPFPIFVDPYDARVLGQLPSSAWLPGLTRALHGGWPIRPAGSWLLELGDGWAILMLLTGLYLWWPRGRSFGAALWPRFRSGTRILLRDLHSCVAVWFSLVLLFFLISALPWTDFWGGHLLTRLEQALDQVSPAGFSPGGATAAQMKPALSSLDEVAAAARAHQVKGTLDIRLAPWPGATWYMTNTHISPGEDRTLTGDIHTGAIVGDFRSSDLPIIPRLVALGVHVHQGDFGPVNLWLNTAFAFSLMWLSATGFVSWWLRRPAGQLAVPPKPALRHPRFIAGLGAVLCVLLPLFGLSVLIIFITEALARTATSRSEPMQGARDN